MHHMTTKARQRQSFTKTVFQAIIVILFLSLAPPILAIYDPLSVPNNRFGMHIADLNDVPDVAPLVNSTGGDWGYVTLVAPQTDHNTSAWQKLFDDMRRLHLIPIVRLATKPEGASWKKPSKGDIRDWVSFLTSLNWPTENRYVVVFNEPNHAKEWGNTIDPEGYADILVTFAKALKEANEDFFILPAGLDASAASNGDSLDAAEYLKRMVSAKPELLDLIDGWTSHSYPNPGFSGSPYAWGRGTLWTFSWELELLRSLGLKKSLPVFITETGWTHSEGKFWQPRSLRPEGVGANLAIAAGSVWQDARIAAITPFVFNYQDYPFDHFSFKQLGNGEYYAHYASYQAITKQQSKPRQRESYEIDHPLLPEKLVAGSTYALQTKIKNTGQGIADASQGYELVIEDSKGFAISDVSLPRLEPGQRETLTFSLTTPNTPGVYPVKLIIRHNDNIAILEAREITLIPPPTLVVQTHLGWKRTSNAKNAKVLVYDGHELTHEFPDLALIDGTAVTPGLTNITPGKRYRIVLVIPSFLPAQTSVAVKETETLVRLPRLLPLDFDEDGALTLSDVTTLLKLQPHAVLNRFFGK
ncbi:MAG: hypothetical protein UY16_C0010G0020 [Candidatus Gottesmanbacteria bacterium GW2011_GWA2_47_9]|uniref:CARDB domain-containing protein n=1 Tax=Candidatus Gottesmanbacteria bacterium GW2011_GWA2_47_9 TaxID=1618445 RepID=A0A0G1U2F9_9BACT|nr:MAG: hypothetical protein UY16_C0010G0020 [Candidatus Gottesmanbacteria bacterium GW2011_GWA2_47_9]